MSGGSKQPESDADVRCRHCGRCYRNDGIHGHEANCELADHEDVYIVPPAEWDDDRLGLEGPDPHETDPPTPGEGPDTPLDGSSEGEDSGAYPSDPEAPGGQEATTDGGTSPVQDLPAFDESNLDGSDVTQSVEGDVDDLVDDPDCPDCGAEDYVDATEALRAGDYGAEETRALANHDRVCAECGEVYDA